MKTGGACARFAGRVHTSCVMARSRFGGGRSEALSGAFCAAMRASRCTQRKESDWRIGLVTTTGFPVCAIAFSVVRVMRTSLVRMFAATVHIGFVAVRTAAEQGFKIAGRNARQRKYHRARRDEAESERKLWLAVSHAVSPSSSSVYCHVVSHLR